MFQNVILSAFDGVTRNWRPAAEIAVRRRGATACSSTSFAASVELCPEKCCCERAAQWSWCFGWRRVDVECGIDECWRRGFEHGPHGDSAVYWNWYGGSEGGSYDCCAAGVLNERVKPGAADVFDEQRGFDSRIVAAFGWGNAETDVGAAGVPSTVRLRLADACCADASACYAGNDDCACEPSAGGGLMSGRTLPPGVFYPPFQPSMVPTTGWGATAGTIPSWTTTSAAPAPMPTVPAASPPALATATTQAPSTWNQGVQQSVWNQGLQPGAGLPPTSAVSAPMATPVPGGYLSPPGAPTTSGILNEGLGRGCIAAAAHSLLSLVIAVSRAQRVESYGFRCLLCKHVKSGNIIARPRGPTYNVVAPNELLHWDFLYMGESVGEGQYVLVLKDGLTHYCELGAFDFASSIVVATALIGWWKRFGSPFVLISDQGSHFKNDAVRQVCKRLQIEQELVLAYAPWINKTVERINRDIRQVMRLLLIVIARHSGMDVRAAFGTRQSHTAVASLDNRLPEKLFSGLRRPSPFKPILIERRGKSVVLDHTTSFLGERLEQLHSSMAAMNRAVVDRREQRRPQNMQQSKGSPCNFSVGDFVL
ncbi:unnamed protein product [Phytophthora lilii]|uniref:Unnamed protein product n=1 Tax=Phytophthora lilii TaxID=2077276 RepID=A0A9W6WK63_9STRA|nr:unnamed protein product [Phytophthora lilii]